jgi:hypothetical protein
MMDDASICCLYDDLVVFILWLKCQFGKVYTIDSLAYLKWEQ